MEMCLVVEAKGFEPSTPCLQSRCSRLHRECNAVPERTFVSGNYGRCPPPAAWRLSHRVAECAEVWTHSDRRYLLWCFKAGAARHQANQYIGVTLSLILTFGRGNYCIGVPSLFYLTC